MGVSTSPSQFAGKIERFGKAVGDNRGPVTTTTNFVRDVMQGAFSAAGVKPTTAPIRAKIVDSNTGLVYGAGKAALIDKGARPHIVSPRGGVTRSKSVMFTGLGLSTVVGHALGGGAAALAGHPVPFVFLAHGSRGKHAWPKGEARARVEAPKVMMKAQVSTPLKAIFG